MPKCSGETKVDAAEINYLQTGYYIKPACDMSKLRLLVVRCLKWPPLKLPSHDGALSLHAITGRANTFIGCGILSR